MTTEINLKLALSAYDGVESVDFETVWERTHEYAERNGGDRIKNCIEWVISCTKN